MSKEINTTQLEEAALESFMNLLISCQFFYIIASIISCILLGIFFIIYKMNRGYIIYSRIIMVITGIFWCLSLVFLFLLLFFKKRILFRINEEIFKKKLPENILWISLIFLTIELIILTIYEIFALKKKLFDSDKIFNIFIFSIKILSVSVLAITTILPYFIEMSCYIGNQAIYTLLMIFILISKMLLAMFLLMQLDNIREYTSRLRNIGSESSRDIELKQINL